MEVPSQHAVEPSAEPAQSEPGTADGEPPSWPDESAEAAFLGEAKERGESVAPKPVAREVEEADPRALPQLDVLVNRIPTEVRDVLEELFRAKFVKVQRVPKRAFKT